MSKNCFTFNVTMGFWEGEMLVKALENYNPKKADEKCSKQDLIRHLEYQMEKQKNEVRQVSAR